MLGYDNRHILTGALPVASFNQICPYENFFQFKYAP
jgi:hypothetical protein